MDFLKPLHKNLLKNKFIQSIILLVSGTAGSQIILILASPLLTRIYSPDSFGTLALFISIVMIMSMLATFRYELSLPLPKNSSIATNLLFISSSLSLIICSIIGLFIYFYGEIFFTKTGLQTILDFAYLIPFGILVFSFYNIFVQFNIRKKNFSLIAKAKIFQTIATLIIQIAFYKFGAFSLLIGHIFGLFIGFILLVDIKKFKNFKINFKKSIILLISYKRFPLFSTPAGFIRVSGLELPIIVLTSFFNPAAAGLYALANRVLNAPISAIGNAVSQAFIPTAVESNRMGSLNSLVKKIHRNMSILAMPLTIILVFFSQEIFIFVFGSEWVDAGRYAQWMAPWLYVVFVSTPLTTLTTILDRQKEGLIYNCLLFIGRILSLYIGVELNNVMITIILFASVNLILRFVFMLWLSSIAGCSIKIILFDTLKSLSLSFLVLSPLIIFQFLNLLNIYIVIFSAILLVIYYWRSFLVATDQENV
tara:strand:+ start:1154 stop:2590 length:1437 start_codon:yes stop_codon:yes gene_type:complete